MSDKFSLYQTDGLWGIIENASNEKQTSIKSYFGSDLIIKRLNEQADQINQLKQQNEELMLRLNRQNVEEHKPVYCTLAGTECEYLGKVEELKQQLAEKQKTIDEINKEFVQAIHDWKTLCAEKDKEIEDWKQKTQTFLNRVNEQNYEIANNNPKQLAIQELEKVKNKCNGMYELWLYSNHKENMYNNEDIAGVFEDISVFTNDLIKKLKGEK